MRLILAVAQGQSDDVVRALGQANISHELICQVADCSKAPACRWVGEEDLNSSGVLAAAVLDAIETLEQTRHAFRSKQLGDLRRRLEALLERLPAS
ncbi:hypothetical protein [Halopseudomonas pelagia]